MTHVHSEITLLNRESLVSGIAGSVFVSIDKRKEDIRMLGKGGRWIQQGQTNNQR